MFKKKAIFSILVISVLSLTVGCTNDNKSEIESSEEVEIDEEVELTEEENNYISEMNNHMVSIYPVVDEVRALVSIAFSSGTRDEEFAKSLLTNVQKFDAIIPHIREESVPTRFSEMNNELMIALDEMEEFTSTFMSVYNGQGSENSMGLAFATFGLADNLITTYKEKLEQVQY